MKKYSLLLAALSSIYLNAYGDDKPVIYPLDRETIYYEDRPSIIYMDRKSIDNLKRPIIDHMARKTIYPIAENVTDITTNERPRWGGGTGDEVE
jgi:hypothetical protein